MMKGPIRELIPVEAAVSVKIPSRETIRGVKLLFSDEQQSHTMENGRINVKVPKLLDHEIIALDLT